VNPLVPAVLEHMQQKATAPATPPAGGLTGIWNAAVRAAVVSRLRASGLPQDDLLLRLQKLSPTLGFAAEDRQSAREWVADPFTQDALLVQQCVVRLLFALRAWPRPAVLSSSPPRSPQPRTERIMTMAAIPESYRDCSTRSRSRTSPPSVPTARHR
jgi:hypothetical protein